MDPRHFYVKTTVNDSLLAFFFVIPRVELWEATTHMLSGRLSSYFHFGILSLIPLDFVRNSRDGSGKTSLRL